MVANAELGWKINFETIIEEENLVRDDSFPGLVYRDVECVKTALVFSSGKIVFTGAQDMDQIEKAFEDLKKKLKKYKKV